LITSKWIKGLLLSLGLSMVLQSCSFQSLLIFIKPPKSFEKTATPSPPNYSNYQHWHLLDPRDTIGKAVDVFFIHPTTYIKGKHWNQQLDDHHVNWRTRELPMRFQASLFYRDYRMFIPKYRQAVFYSFADKKDNGEQALDTAYSDVKAAFEHYLKKYNEGRPFILAAHSQGSFHAKRLLAELEADVLDRLVVGYVVGWPIEEHYFQENTKLQPCTTATQNHCIVSWNTESGEPKMSIVEEVAEDATVFCVNPLSWSVDSTHISKQKNKGAFQRNEKTGQSEIILHYCDAQVEDGAVKITPPANQKELQMPMGKGNYHLYDYSFFYQNIRENAAARTKAFLKKNKENEEVKTPFYKDARGG